MAGRIESRVGVVNRILAERDGCTEILVSIDDRLEKAINYVDLTGKVAPGDRVLLNTTAVNLRLGTGGYHFVRVNLTRPETELSGPGHIMKLRYTPEQVKVLSVEEGAAGFQELFNRFESLEGFPVVIFSLHSVLAPLVISFKLIRATGKITYIMTDGGALPASFSHTLADLKNAGLIHKVITCGHAFGGDYEAVNIFSALIAAKEITGADVAVIGMGPGIVGTGTKWGFSGIQLGEAINAVNILGGRPVFCPRISFADPRERHRGISHHSLTILSKVALTPAIVVMPHLPSSREKVLQEQLAAAGIYEKHSIIWEHGERGLEKLKETSFSFCTMGRNLDEEREFFLGACAGGIYAGKISGQVGLN
jgi:hypothetical protein